MLNNSKLGDGIYDSFLGSGTTLIAAETTGKSCVVIEIDPLYVDVAVRRWQAFTGKNATLDSDGRTFEMIAEQRLSEGDRSKPSAATHLRGQDNNRSSKISPARKPPRAKRQTAARN